MKILLSQPKRKTRPKRKENIFKTKTVKLAPKMAKKTRKQLNAQMKS
jgi:hypothetical protein